MNRRTLWLAMMVGMALTMLARPSADDALVTDEMAASRDRAIELNAAGDYLNAYASILQADRLLVDRLTRRGGVKCLHEAELVRGYWPIVKSRGEIAYMLGNQRAMRDVADRLEHTLAERTDIASDENWAATFSSDVAKLKGGVCYLTEQYDSAECYLNRALELRRDFLDYDFDYCYGLRGDLAQLYYQQGRYDRALAQLDTVLQHPAFEGAMRMAAAGEQLLDSRRQEVMSQRAICMARLGQFAQARQILDPMVARLKTASDTRAYAEALRKQGKVMMLEYEATGHYNPQAKQCYEQYLSVARRYVDRHFLAMTEAEREQYWMAERPFVTDCYRLEDKAAPLLYDVALFSKAVLLQVGRVFGPDMTADARAKALAAVRIDWKTVRRQLPRSSVAIEFITYARAGREHLAALVLDKARTSPTFVYLAPVDSLLRLDLGGNVTVEAAIRSRNASDKDRLYTSRQLPCIVWNDALTRAIGENRHVYFAPDGPLHVLAIEYLLPETLRDKQLYRLTSTRLLASGRTTFAPDSMLLCGGIDYRRQLPSAAAVGNDVQAYDIMAANPFNLDYLTWSKVEVDSVRAIRHNPHDLVLHEDSVTEAALRQVIGHYPMVMFSTHGSFVQAQQAGCDLHPPVADTQLSQSCLFLSGAMRNVMDRQFDPTQPDGVFSAREMAGMDLSGVQLVILSACQSGLGYVTPDGVYGLQRGLKAAGVQAIIASLWEVNDQATATLMTAMVGNLAQGMPLRQAFDQARQTLESTAIVKRYPRRGLPDLEITTEFKLPQYTHAFILIDALD